ncbi:GNAT family N-acetyltransferase [Chloroflexota bacterium]
MRHSITEETFSTLSSYWTDPKQNLNWSSVFILPAWLKAWWQEFGTAADLYLRAINQDGEIIGIAPLMLKNNTAFIIGNTEVCDYLDFIITPGMEVDFFSILLDDLRKQGITCLDLNSLRPDSTVFSHLTGVAKERDCDIVSQQSDVSSELELPSTWDEYLALLNKKQRHELRRKLRRLSETNSINYRYVGVNKDNVKDFTDTFLKLFLLSREDKADFMTEKMESFFRSITLAMAEIGILEFGILELDSVATAMIMGFDYNNSVYLYNSAYDPEYDFLSVGLLCKVFGIKDSIEKGKRIFDFLKGDEIYKHHLGGKQVPLYRCQINIK